MSLSNVTNYCACHEKWFSWFSILGTYETSFTLRGATGVIVQRHQILRLPRKMIVQNVREICANRLAAEVSFRARHEHFVWKNIILFRAPAIIPNFTKYRACHEKRQLNFTKYCACHEKWLSWLILVTYKTSFTMRGPTEVILHHHQILPLPRKMTLQSVTEICWKQLKLHLYTKRGRSENDPTMVRAWNHQSATRLATEVTFRARHGHFASKNTAFRAPAVIPNFTKCCACHENWQLNFTKYYACYDKSI